MISAISFMGKEGCIEPAKKATKKVAEYLGKEPIGDIKNEAKKVAKDAIREADAISYKTSHGNTIPAVDKLNTKVAADKYKDAVLQGVPLN